MCAVLLDVLKLSKEVGICLQPSLLLSPLFLLQKEHIQSKLTTSYYTVILERPEILKQYARNQSIEISSHSLLFNPRILKIF